jgi:pimeloyl-ACP methyl ester carboxylesterase
MLAECALGIEISEDRRHTSIAAAGHPVAADGFVVIELAAYLDSPADGVTSVVVALQAARTVTRVAIDPHSHAATLIKPLRAAGVRVTELSTSDVVVAHGDFLDELNAGRIRHVGHPQLDAAVRHGMQRPLGGASTWDRRNAPVDIGPLTAATWALWALRNTSVPQLFVFGEDDDVA